MKFILVRHGETLLNVQHKTQGWCDSPLTDKGIQQAKQVHDLLINIPITKAYSSSSERTIDTAEIILEGRDIPLKIDRRLKELNYGVYEGSLEYIKDLEYKKNPTPYKDFKAFGGEDTFQLTERFSNCIEEIASESEGNDIILIVSHSAAIYRFINNYVVGNVDSIEMHMEYVVRNGEMKVVEYKGGSYRLENTL